MLVYLNGYQAVCFGEALRYLHHEQREKAIQRHGGKLKTTSYVNTNNSLNRNQVVGSGGELR
jgi:hypothetical protein